MKIGYAILGLIVLAFVGYVGWAVSLEPKWKIEHRITINESPDDIWPHIASLPAWEHWSAFHPDFVQGLKQRYSGPESGVGSTMTWSMPDASGITSITAVDEPNDLKYEVVSGDGAFHGYGHITLTKTPDGTDVRWQYRGNSGNNFILKVIMTDLLPEMDSGNKISLKMLKLRAE